MVAEAIDGLLNDFGEEDPGAVVQEDAKGSQDEAATVFFEVGKKGA